LLSLVDNRERGDHDFTVDNDGEIDFVSGYVIMGRLGFIEDFTHILTTLVSIAKYGIEPEETHVRRRYF
jgi:hypothetical protein